MNPSSIRNLLTESESLLSDSLQSNRYVIPAFLSSWVAWEALRTRFIRVLMHHQGWMLKDADAILAKRKLSSMAAAESVIIGLGLVSPHNWPGKSSNAWKLLVEIEPLRHRLVHGYKTIDPARIKAASRLVLYLSLNHEWLEDVPVVDAPRKRDRIIVGSILAARRSSSKCHNRSLGDLAQAIDVDLRQGSRRLPSLEYLERKICSYGA